MVNIDYLYNPDAAKPLFEKNYFVDKKLGYQVIEHGTILPYNSTNDEGKITWTGFGGIVDAKGKYLSESYVHVGLGGAYTPPSNQFNTVLKPLFTSEFLFTFGGIA